MFNINIPLLEARPGCLAPLLQGFFQGIRT